MKYLSISILFHLLILVVLAYYQGFKKNYESPSVVVELYVSNQESSKIGTPEESKYKRPRNLRTTNKNSAVNITKKREESSQENKVHQNDIQKESSLGSKVSQNFLKSQEGQRMIQSYAEELKIYLEQNKIYPRIAQKLRQSGTVTVKLQIQSDGRFGDIKVVSPSPFESLNQAAVTLLKKLGHFKPLPEKFDSEGEFIVPIAYRLR